MGRSWQKAKWPESEAAMAAILVEFMEGQKWDVYQEVRLQPDYQNSRVADIVGVRYVEKYDREIVWIIECKKSLNLAVCEQALTGKPYCHMTSVAVPRKYEQSHGGYRRRRKMAQGYNFAQVALKQQGIGLMLISDPTQELGLPIEMVLNPAYRTDAHIEREVKRLREWLQPEHKTMAKAGTKGDKIVTPFSLTVMRLIQTVRDTTGWISLRDALTLTKHHYRSINGGVCSLADMIDRKVIDGLEIKREGRKVFVRCS